MFERYTEKARRAIFFARYEASEFGSPCIETEHLLLGLLREDKALFFRFLREMTYLPVQEEVRRRTVSKEKFPTSVDLPLSPQSKRALAHAGEEADRLNHRHIGTEHLLLGLLREGKDPGAQLLQKYGAKLEDLRKKIAETPGWGPDKPRISHQPSASAPPAQPPAETIEIHGARWNLEYIHEAVMRCREHSWYWHKQAWKKRDIVMDRQSGRVSFDLRLAADPAKFELVKEGWKKDRCAVCRWELYEAPEDETHNTGYTNGRGWLCTECFEKFMGREGFFSSPYSDIT